MLWFLNTLKIQRAKPETCIALLFLQFSNQKDFLRKCETATLTRTVELQLIKGENISESFQILTRKWKKLDDDLQGAQNFSSQKL